MTRPQWMWRFKIMSQACDVRSALSVGVTIAYQRPTPMAWRGVFVTLIVGTLLVGWHYAEG